MEMETTVSKSLRVLVLLGLATFAIALTVLLTTGFAAASSHREAPAISKDPYADTTDVYAFIPPGITDTIVLAASWIPFEGPEGGPNYFEWDDAAQYQINVDNNGDAVADYIFELTSNTAPGTLDSFLYNNGPIGTAGENWLRPQTYTVTEKISGDVIVSNRLAPPANIGGKSTPNWAYDFFKAAYGANDTLVYAGQTDDAFWVDLQVFDLLTLRGQDAPIGYGGVGTNDDPVDSVSGFNVHSLILEMPIANLTQGDETVLGVWATTTRESMSVTPANGGGATQVSRLGMPLVNEAVIPMAAKDIFNGLPPANDLAVYIDQGPFQGLLQEAVENPELGTLLCALYGVPLPEDSNADCNTEYTPTDGAGVGAGSGRGDIFQIFLTGMKLTQPFTITTAGGAVMLPAGFNVNQFGGAAGGGSTPSEMIRINTAISGDLCAPEPSVLGVLGGDACGFPNGRRLTDEVVEIELLAVAGAAYQVLDGQDAAFEFNPALIGVLDDGIGENDVAFTRSSGRNHLPPDMFPYFAPAQSGQDHLHTNPMGVATAVNLDTLQTAGMFDSALPEIALGMLGLTLFVGAVYVTRSRASRQ